MYQGDCVPVLSGETDRTTALSRNLVQSHDLWPNCDKGCRKLIEILEQLAYLMLNSHHAFSTQYHFVDYLSKNTLAVKKEQPRTKIRPG